MTISKAVSERIREFVAEKGISLYKLELNSGLSKGTFTSLIYNRYKSVNLTTLITIIRTLEMSVSEFFDNPLFDIETLDIN